MASLQTHKRRIKSIDSTSSIARAMELVSSVKLKKLKQRYDNAINYLSNIEETIKEVLSVSEEKPKFNDEGINLNIVITSNLGLCGAYNDEVLKVVGKEIINDNSYITFGDKGKNFLNSKNCKIILSYSEYDGFNINTIQEEFSNYLFKYINEEKIKNINVIYTKYINNLKYEVVKEMVYPFELAIKEKDIDYLIEPNDEAMIQEMTSLLVKTKINSVLLNATLSENASRNTAMKKAKDNAEELKEELILVYNKLRQQQITNEISDIINGM